jgi:CBS domain-containing protein
MTTDGAPDKAQTLDRLLGTVAEAMHSEVLLLDPDTPADVAARRLERAGVSGAPVVRHGRAVGVVTLRDLFTAVGHDVPRTRQDRSFATRMSWRGTASAS